MFHKCNTHIIDNLYTQSIKFRACVEPYANSILGDPLFFEETNSKTNKVKICTISLFFSVHNSYTHCSFVYQVRYNDGHFKSR